MEHTYTESNAAARLPGMPAANVGSTERVLTVIAGAALLGYALKRNDKKLGLASAGMLLRGATGYCPAYAVLGANHADTKQALAGSRGVHVRESITINAPAQEIYRFWRHLSRLPEVMPHLAKVEELDTKRSRWTAKAFDQVPVTWDAEIIDEQPFELISWATLPGQWVQNAGSVQFNPASDGSGTEVHVHLQYSGPSGKASGWLAWLVGEDPAKRLREGLLKLKTQLEASANL